MDIEEIVNITSRAWALSILALLHAGVPARRAKLLHASGASRTAFTQSLTHLIDLGLLERNPGHGHPLRPEFRLTEKGKPASAMAWRILEGTKLNNQPLLRRSWTVPILSTLREPRHFNQIRTSLPIITDRALSQSLKAMEGVNWIKRDIVDTTRPPRSLYSAVNQGQEISAAIATHLR